MPPTVTAARVGLPASGPAGRETGLRGEERSRLQRVRWLIIVSVTGESSNPGHRAAGAPGSARPAPQPPRKGSGSPRTESP